MLSAECASQFAEDFTVFKPSSYFNNNNIDRKVLWIRIFAQTALDQMVGTDQGTAVKGSHPLFSTQAATVSVRFCKNQGTFSIQSLFFTKPSEMADTGCSNPCQPLEVINDLRRCCFGDIRKTLDQITNMMTMAEMLRMMNEPSQKIIVKKNDSKNRKFHSKRTCLANWQHYYIKKGMIPYG